MPHLEPQESAAVVTAASTINRLLQLDEVWTEAALARYSSSQLDSQQWGLQMRGIGNEMMEQLRLTRDQVPVIGELAEKYAGEGEEVLRTLLWGHVLEPSERDDLRFWVSGRGFIDVSRDGMSVFTSEAVDSELESVNAQVQQLLAELGIEGDLSKEFRCGAANGLLTGGILMIPTGIAGGVGALTVGTLAAAAGFATGGVGLVIAGAALWWARRRLC